MTRVLHSNDFRLRICEALDFMETHPGGRNRRLTAEERDGKPWVSVAMNFDTRDDAFDWVVDNLENNKPEREGKGYSDTQGYYKSEFPWGLVYAHFPKTI